jgi:heterodisulfide reductase subunit A-like polyferredoxin
MGGISHPRGGEKDRLDYDTSRPGIQVFMKRRFTGLRSRQPDRSYDAVIIGAGIGGLICANLLAREGLSVLLIEQHYMVGGYCSTFRRKGYTFDAATHFYP